MRYVGRPTLLVTGVLLTILILVQAATRDTTEGAVAVAPTSADQGAVVAAPGRVEPTSEEIRVGSQITGKVNGLLVAEGQTVSRGDVLLTLDDAEYAARLSSARARAAGRAAVLQRTISGARDQERLESRAMLDEAQAALEWRRAEWARRKELVAADVISREDAERSEQDLRMAEARHEAARQRHALVTAEARPEDVRHARAELDLALAEVAEAESTLSKTVIRSPIAGLVLRTHVRPGENVSGAPDTPLVTVADVSTLRVRAEVDEADIGRIRLNQRAWATAAAYDGRRFFGRVVRIAQILGRKKIVPDTPTDRVDTRILEVLVDLEPDARVPIGLRVDTFFGDEVTD